MRNVLPIRYAEYVQLCKELRVQPKPATYFVEKNDPLQTLNKEFATLLNKESQKYLYSRMDNLIHMGTGSFDSYVTDVDKQGVSKADIEENQQLIEYVAELNEKLDELRENLNTDELSEEQKDTKETLQSLKDDHSNYLEVIEKLKTQTTQVEGLTQAIGKFTSLNPSVSQVQSANVVQKAQLSKLPFWGDDVSEEQQSDLIRYLRELLQVENEQRDLDEDRNQELRELTNKQEVNSETLKKQTEDIRKANKKTSESLKESSMRMLAHFKVSKKTQDSMMDLLATIAPFLILWGIGKLTEMFPGFTGRADEAYSEMLETLSPEEQKDVEAQVKDQENLKAVQETYAGDWEPTKGALGKIAEGVGNFFAGFGGKSDNDTYLAYKDKKTGKYLLAPSTSIGKDGVTGLPITDEARLKQIASGLQSGTGGAFTFNSEKDLNDFLKSLEKDPNASQGDKRRKATEALDKYTIDFVFPDAEFKYIRTHRNTDPKTLQMFGDPRDAADPNRQWSPNNPGSYGNGQRIDMESYVPSRPSRVKEHISLPMNKLPLLEGSLTSQQELVAESTSKEKPNIIHNYVTVNNYNQQYSQFQDPNQTTT